MKIFFSLLKRPYIFTVPSHVKGLSLHEGMNDSETKIVYDYIQIQKIVLYLLYDLSILNCIVQSDIMHTCILNFIPFVIKIFFLSILPKFYMRYMYMKTVNNNYMWIYNFVRCQCLIHNMYFHNLIHIRYCFRCCFKVKIAFPVDQHERERGY